MKNQDVSKKYTIIVLLLALVVVGSIVLMIQNRSIQSKQSDASAINRNIICWPNDIVAVVSPKDGSSYSVGDQVEISWDQLKVNKPVRVQIMSVGMEINDDYGHCSSALGTDDYLIADSLNSVEGRNTYIWEIPKDYPENATGDNRVIWVSTDYNIPTNPPSLLQASRDYSDGYFTVQAGK